MLRRFYSDSPIETEQVILDGSEAHHLLHVLRASEGDRVTLFDGYGAEFEAEVIATGRKQVELQIVERHEVDRELGIELVLAVSLPKGDRQEWLVQKAVEIGVTRLVPLSTERSVAKSNEKSLARMRRSVIEASKQCRRNRLMEIDQPTSWNAYAAKDVSDRETSRIVAHPEGGQRFDDCVSTKHQSCHIAIGPEGGFSDDEVKFAIENDFKICDLGASILRTETAAIVAAGYVRLLR